MELVCRVAAYLNPSLQRTRYVGRPPGSLLREPLNSNFGQLSTTINFPLQEEAMNISKTFVEGIATLVVTAILSGFLIPYILKKIDDQKTRQSKIIEAQAKFLDDISQLLWKWRYMCIKVAYYGSRDNEERYNTARKEYDEGVWDVLNQIRGEISRSRRLVSEKAYQELVALYREIVELDNKLSALMVNERLNEKQRQELSELNQFIYEQVTMKIDDMLNFLASELRLKSTT